MNNFFIKRIFFVGIICFWMLGNFSLLYGSESRTTKKQEVKKTETPLWKKIGPSKRTKYQNVPTAVAGVRGIREEEIEGKGDVNSRDWNALQQVEISATGISDGDIERFVNEGGLK